MLIVVFNRYIYIDDIDRKGSGIGIELRDGSVNKTSLCINGVPAVRPRMTYLFIGDFKSMPELLSQHAHVYPL